MFVEQKITRQCVFQTTANDVLSGSRFKPLAHRVTQLYEFCLMNPVLFHLTRPQWDKLNKTFSRLLEEVALEANDDLQAVVKRYAFMVMIRVLMFLKISA